MCLFDRPWRTTVHPVGVKRDGKAPIAVAVGQKIAEIRRSKGMRQKDVAHSIRKAVKWWSRVEQGEENLMLTTLEEIAGALAVPPSDLLIPVVEPMPVKRGRPRKTPSSNGTGGT